MQMVSRLMWVVGASCLLVLPGAACRDGSSSRVQEGTWCYLEGIDLQQCAEGLYCDPQLDNAGRYVRKKVKFDQHHAVGTCKQRGKLGSVCKSNSACDKDLKCGFENGGDKEGTCMKQ